MRKISKLCLSVTAVLMLVSCGDSPEEKAKKQALEIQIMDFKHSGYKSYVNNIIREVKPPKNVKLYIKDLKQVMTEDGKIDPNKINKNKEKIQALPDGSHLVDYKYALDDKYLLEYTKVKDNYAVYGYLNNNDCAKITFDMKNMKITLTQLSKDSICQEIFNDNEIKEFAQNGVSLQQ